MYIIYSVSQIVLRLVKIRINLKNKGLTPSHRETYLSSWLLTGIMVDFESYVPMIDAILSASDPDQVTPKRIRKALQELFGVNLDSQRKVVNQIIVERFQEIQSRPRVLITQEELVKKDEELAHQLQQEDSGGKRKKTSKVKRRKTEKTGSNNNSLSSRNVMLAEPLSNFLGETSLPRTQVVKLVWDYIKKNDLQNPQDRREILCNKEMEPIFGKKMTMFSMNKILSKFLYNPDEVTKTQVKKDSPTDIDRLESDTPSGASSN